MIDHLQHNAQWFEAGKMEMGGPFLSVDGRGMMIPTSAVTLDETEAFAAADPAVKFGLLAYEVRPWYVAMQKEG